MTTSFPPARLILEDGACFRGRAFGGWAESPVALGEAVFNTALTGYQEALTDPSYSGQILAMTAPEIGVYGVCPDDDESAHPQVAGFAVRELTIRPSNYRSGMDLDTWLRTHGVPGICGIDTRALVRRIRIHGACRAGLVSDPKIDDAAALALVRAAPSMAGRDLACVVGARDASDWRDDLGDWTLPGTERRGGRPLRVLALDCGAKRNILRHLVARGLEVRVVPHTISAAEVRAAAPDGLFVSNGPGDPAAIESTVAMLAEVAGEIPTFGICMGHQLLALALGATTFKLKFGHRGANQPVRDLLTGTVEITSQNHGFCVDEQSLLDAGVEVTHRHLNDGTVAGFRHPTRPVFAVQYHPEAAPGPHDATYLFDCFVAMMTEGRPLDEAMVRGVRARRDVQATQGAPAGNL